MHSHRCDGCGTIWSHELPKQPIAMAEYAARHACPQCGQDQRKIDQAKPNKEDKEIAKIIRQLIPMLHHDKRMVALGLLVALAELLAELSKDERELLAVTTKLQDILLVEAAIAWLDLDGD
jgi:predicted RNA-binding Zn-ribbon protein involved in translation (DUF1610 family)